MTRQRDASAGFTLIEVLVALALFALISGAGFAMLDQVLRTQRTTEGRLERLAGLQRAMHLVTTDFLLARSHSFGMTPGTNGPTIRVRRNATDIVEGAVKLEYQLEDGVLTRTVSRGNSPPIARQPLLPGVASANWKFYDWQSGWRADWPPPGQLPGTDPPNPSAVELRITFEAGQELRRVALLPHDSR